MTITVKNIEFKFIKQEDPENVNEMCWATTVNIGDNEVSFSFRELMPNGMGKMVKVDPKGIECFLEHIVAHYEVIQEKGKSVLAALHNAVFGREGKYDFESNSGDFKLIDIMLTRFNLYEITSWYSFTYEGYYSLESKDDILFDPYHAYIATFSNNNGLTIISARREG